MNWLLNQQDHGDNVSYQETFAPIDDVQQSNVYHGISKIFLKKIWKPLQIIQP